MTRSKLALAVLLGGAVLVGCDSKSDTTTTPATPPAPKPQADTGSPATPSNPSTMVPPAATDAAARAQVAAGDAASKTQADASAQIAQVMQYIKDNKYDMADQTLSKLEANKASFPDAVQKQIESARSALNASKAGGGMKMPDVPAMGK